METGKINFHTADEGWTNINTMTAPLTDEDRETVQLALGIIASEEGETPQINSQKASQIESAESTLQESDLSKAVEENKEEPQKTQSTGATDCVESPQTQELMPTKPTASTMEVQQETQPTEDKRNFIKKMAALCRFPLIRMCGNCCTQLKNRLCPKTD